MVRRDRAERLRREVTEWCAHARTPQDLLHGVAALVRPVIRCDAAVWMTTDPATVLFTDALIEGFPHTWCDAWFHHELETTDVAQFATLGGGRQPTAILSEATGGDLPASGRWREVLQPAGLGHELRAVFRDSTGCWGAVSLHRPLSDPDFSAHDARALAGLSTTLAEGLRAIALRQDDDAVPEGPGLLLVTANGGVRPGTEAGSRWLSELGILPNGPLDDAAPGTALRTLGRLVANSTLQGQHETRRLRLQTRAGRWVTLHAERLAGQPGGVAVIVEPSRPADLAGVFALAYGLTPREQEVTYALARGEDTGRIARRLEISTYTVRDHLKSAFAKTGAGTRSELVARLFTDQYADQFFSEAAHAS
jgi:DNA-binding CsgD family transcriptional regulator